MYNSGYSQVSKYSMQGGKKMPYRSKGKSCGYYMRIVFFFSSLIQSLIIVSLVLFLIYGKQQDSASTSRVHDLEESFSRLSLESVSLKLQRKNLTTLLNSTLIEKARNDWDLGRCRFMSNISIVIIQDLEKKNKLCDQELTTCKYSINPIGPCPRMPVPGNCGLSFEQMKARLELVESNFTQTVQKMRMDMDQIVKHRDNLHLEVIQLRRDKSTHDKTVEIFRHKCKDDFADSLSSISNVTKAFLYKIDTLFPSHIAFQLTCPKQREHLEQIRTNCTSLSREVEDKFQNYLNSVGEQVSIIQAENSHLKAENGRLSDDYRRCSQNRTDMQRQHKQIVDTNQRKHDEEKEKLLLDKLRLNGEIGVLNNKVNYKTKEAEHLSAQLKQLNMSCMHRATFPGSPTSRLNTLQTGWNTYGGGSSSSSSSSTGVGQNTRTGSGLSSSGSTYNRPVATGAGSSSSSGSSYGSSSSTGSTYNKVATGAGSSGSSSTSYGSTYNKPVSSGGYGSVGSNPSLSSSGTGLNKPVQTGRGSIATGSTSGSTGSIPNYSSGGTGLNKPTTNVKPPSSTGSTGSPSKSGFGFSWFGNSNSGQSKTGTGPGRGASSGSNFGGTGLSAGAGKTSGQGASVAQHLQDLQRLINPTKPEEKQDLSRLLG
ncbi:plasmalemma vesicle associated protein a isoform X2 [Larimichthys crocea]|uniref:plasmalemma vesicle associated protein a isoform X2 n=1 Tax=Larimichthys crocea TaxID=215358 RepID=UPI0009016AF1|nr:plasmalemma vesicle-associated protein-like isoform X2 [Larimichthys crocea]